MTKPSDLDLVWDMQDPAGWDALLARAGRSAVEQAWAYGEAVAAVSRRSVHRGVVADGDGALALVQVFERPIGRLARLVQITRGPLLIGERAGATWLAELYGSIGGRWRKARRAFVFWMPELIDGPESHAAMRAVGTRRMVTGRTTAWIDLALPDEALRAALHGKWRNALVAAERTALRIETTSRPGPRLDWLLAHYEAERRRKRYLGPTAALIRAYAEAAAPGKGVLMLRALNGARPVAGVLFLRHGRAATYYVGWTDDDGRRLRAHNLLLWRALAALRAAGLAWLDLGGIDPAAAPGVARFKLGMGGEVVTLAGTYL